MGTMQQVLSSYVYSAAATATAVTLQANASSTTGTITIPANTAAGDIAVLFQYARGVGGYIDGDVFGELVANNRIGTTTVGIWGSISFKTLVSGDPGDGVATNVGGQEQSAVMLVFRPNGTVSSVTAAGSVANATLSNPTALTISASSSVKPYISFAHYVANVPVDPRTSNVTMTEVSAAGGDQYIKYKTYATGDTAEDISIDMDDEGSNILQGFYLYLTI